MYRQNPFGQVLNMAVVPPSITLATLAAYKIPAVQQLTKRQIETFTADLRRYFSIYLGIAGKPAGGVHRQDAVTDTEILDAIERVQSTARSYVKIHTAVLLVPNAVNQQKLDRCRLDLLAAIEHAYRREPIIAQLVRGMNVNPQGIHRTDSANIYSLRNYLLTAHNRPVAAVLPRDIQNAFVAIEQCLRCRKRRTMQYSADPLMNSLVTSLVPIWEAVTGRKAIGSRDVAGRYICKFCDWLTSLLEACKAYEQDGVKIYFLSKISLPLYGQILQMLRRYYKAGKPLSLWHDQFQPTEKKKKSRKNAM